MPVNNIAEDTSIQTNITASITTVLSESPEITESVTISGTSVTTVLSETTSISESTSVYETTLPVTETERESETSIITTLLPVETTAFTSIESAVSNTDAVTSNPISSISETEIIPAEPTISNQVSISSNAVIAGAALIAVVSAFIVSKFKGGSKKVKNSSDPVTAKERDRLRVEEKKAIEKAKKKKESLQNGNKKKVSIPRTVADTIPYKKICANDIWMLADKIYSKVYVIEDINYNLGDENQQNEMLESYCSFLNTLDDTVECQITVWNNKINIDDYEKKILVKKADDGFDDVRNEYNEKVLKPNISKGQNATRKQIIITMTIKSPDEETALRRFNTIDLETKNSFDRVGNTHLRPLSNQERLELLKNVFIGADVKIPELTADDYKKGLDKVYIAPDYFEFKSDYFMFGEYYAKCIFIKEYPTTATDNILNDLMSTNLQLMVTTNIFPYDTAAARKLVQRQITAVETNMAQRESAAAKAGNFSSSTPVKIKNQIESYKLLYEMITVNDQKLFSVNTIIMITAKSYDELNTNTELVGSTLKRNGCMYSQMKWQQEDGMCDVLPIGTQRKFEWHRTLPTESIGIFVPFNVKEIQQEGGIYYGLNKLSNNIITYNKIKSLINPAGFILGCPGSGKSFSAKREMVATFLTDATADIIIIDPEREYPSIVNMFDGESVRISTGSKNFINPFDFDLALLEDDDVDVICDKCQLIQSFISCMDSTRPLSPQEASFIDRCVRKTYLKSNYLNTLDPKDIPTLGDFRDVMADETENIDEDMKRNLLLTLEMYVEGSASYFNNQTNVNVNNRLISFDIKDLSGVLKTQAMLLVLDNIWNRLSANRDKGVATWIYIDEIHVLFSDAYCLNFIRQLYKRARKYGGVLTGITQNVEDLLKDDECRTMLSNSEFLLLLKQSASDSLRLQDTLHFTDSELFYVNNVGPGEGIMVLGGKDKIPFYDKFPTDTQLYSNMTTNFSETQALMQASK